MIRLDVCLEDLVLIRNCLKNQMQSNAQDSRHDIEELLESIDGKIQKEITTGEEH